MKKRNLLLSFIMVFCLCLALAAPAWAAETDSVNLFSEVFFYDAESNEMLTENGEPFAFDDIQFDIPYSGEDIKDGIEPTGDFVEYYSIRSGLKKTSGGKYTW